MSQLHSEETPHIRYRQIRDCLLCLGSRHLPSPSTAARQESKQDTKTWRSNWDGEKQSQTPQKKKQVYKLMVTTRKQTGMAYCKTCKNILLKISSAYLPSFATEKEKSNSYCEVLHEKSMVQLIKIHQHHDAILLPLTTED